MTHDASSASYSYDVRNLLTQVINKETSSDSGKTTSYTYTPASKIATEAKANGNVVSTTYNLDDSVASVVEKTSNGTVVAQHTLTYDPNGNVTQDASVTQSADDNSSDLNRTTTNTYTPRDQIESVANSDGNDNQSYTYDLAGNITSQTVGGTTTSNVFDRNRLLAATSGGTTADYNYDPFGRIDTVTGAGQIIERYTYDGFDHVTSEAKNTGSGLVTTDYAYVPFDRTVSQTENADTSSAKTTDFDYLATSTALVDETVTGTLTKTYQYAPSGERLDQIVHNSDGTEAPTYYTYNPHTDVQAITDVNGNTKATYGYTAYGKDDTSQDTGVDKNTGSGATGTTTASPYNVYRFNHDRIDSDTGNYNMGFRNYDPGMNRFLTRDMYEGAFADTQMTTDPYTGNRYAFGGGNPLSNVELDGHDYVGWAFPQTDPKPKSTGDGFDFMAGVVNGIAQLADMANPVTAVAAPVLHAKNLTLSGQWTNWWKSQGGDTSITSQYWAGGATVDALTAILGGDAGAAEGIDSAVGAADGAETSAADTLAKPPGCSFAASTPVLLADGTTKAIAKIRIGDRVESADPRSGHHQGQRPVMATFVNHDNDLVDLTIRTGPHTSSTIHTTSRHPFWDATLHTWIPAGHLTAGHDLETATDHTVRILAIRTHPGAADMYNLSVQQLHTYYVVAGRTPILVHNTCLKPGEQYVYRVVQNKELQQILATRRYQNVPGIESKYFSSTPEGAAQYAKAAYGSFPQEGPYTLTRGVIQSDAIPAESRIENLADGGGGIDAFALWEDVMSTIGRVRVMPSMPIPPG